MSFTLRIAKLKTWNLIRRYFLILLYSVWVVGAATLCPAEDVSTAATPADPAADQWRSFQNGGDLVIESSTLPLNWSPDAGIAWQVAIEGYGQSSPVIARERIYVTSTSGPNKERCHLTAFAVSDGQQAWQANFDNPSPEENTNYVSRAAPTPVADQDGVIALFEGGLVVAVDFGGQVRWKRNLVDEFGSIKARHGLASSLEQDAESVFVWVERSDDPYLMSIEKSSGETAWKVDGLGATTWSTPRLVPTKHGPQLVCSATGILAGFDPVTGNRLWEFSQLANNTTCTPIPVGEGKFLIGASDGRGEETGGGGASSNGLLQITEDNQGGFAVDFRWRASKATSSFGSPIVAGGRVYFVNRAGVLFEIDGVTGEELLTRRVDSGSVWATPIATPDRLYLFGQKGTTSVLALPSLEKLATNGLWEASATPAGSQAGPPGAAFGGNVLYAAAVANDSLILRRGDVLYCIKSE